jgi:hypothetical protein
MAGEVSIVIQDKGRVLWQFLQYFGPHLFPDTNFAKAVQIMEEDMARIKKGDILTQDELTAKLNEEYLRNAPELKGAFRVRDDDLRTGSPARITFNSVKGTVGVTDVVLDGRAYPLTQFEKAYHDIAITTKDLLLARIGGDFLGPNDDFDDIASIVGSVSGGDIKYQFDLKTGLSRHMYMMNHRSQIEVDGRDMPVIDREGKTAIQNGYIRLYRLLFGSNWFEEVEHVEPYVLQSGQKAQGIAVVSSGDTIKLEAIVASLDLVVYEIPIFESSSMVLTNEIKIGEGNGHLQVLDTISGINEQMSPPRATTFDYMLKNLKPYLVPGK